MRIVCHANAKSEILCTAATNSLENCCGSVTTCPPRKAPPFWPGTGYCKVVNLQQAPPLPSLQGTAAAPVTVGRDQSAPLLFLELCRTATLGWGREAAGSGQPRRVLSGRGPRSGRAWKLRSMSASTPPSASRITNSQASSGPSMAANWRLPRYRSYFRRQRCHRWLTSPTSAPVPSRIRMDDCEGRTHVSGIRICEHNVHELRSDANARENS